MGHKGEGLSEHLCPLLFATPSLHSVVNNVYILQHESAAKTFHPEHKCVLPYLNVLNLVGGLKGTLSPLQELEQGGHRPMKF